jgi:hypothetical protein
LDLDFHPIGPSRGRPLAVPPDGRDEEGDYGDIGPQRQMRRRDGPLGSLSQAKKVKKNVAFPFLLGYFVTKRN